MLVQLHNHFMILDKQVVILGFLHGILFYQIPLAFLEGSDLSRIQRFLTLLLETLDQLATKFLTEESVGRKLGARLLI